MDFRRGCNVNALVLSDSLYRAHKGFGIKEHSLIDGTLHLRTCMCVSSGGALIMPPSSKSKSAIELAMQALRGSSRFANSYLAQDPLVRVIVNRAERSTAQCRFAEQFPNVVFDRSMSHLIGSLETPWTICDLEDVVQQRPDRKRTDVLEICKLRDKRGIYGEPGDSLHFRSDIALEAGDELLKATARAAICKYGVELEGSLLLVLAAGWNTDGTSFSEVNNQGKAWRKAELISLEELCTLNGHPLSKFMAKMSELLRRAGTSHQNFLRQSLGVTLNLQGYGSLDSFCRTNTQKGGSSLLNADNVGMDKRRRRWSSDLNVKTVKDVRRCFSQALKPQTEEVVCIDDESSDAQEPIAAVDSELNSLNTDKVGTDKRRRRWSAVPIVDERRTADTSQKVLEAAHKSLYEDLKMVEESEEDEMMQLALKRSMMGHIESNPGAGIIDVEMQQESQSALQAQEDEDLRKAIEASLGGS